MDRHHARKRSLLERRRQFLLQRITADPKLDCSYDKAEVRALEFALECIDLCEANDLLTPMTGNLTFDTVFTDTPSKENDNGG